MDCYAEPETYSGKISMRWFIMIFVVYYSVYATHTHQLIDFLKTEQSEKQQECLQQVFDH